MKLQINSVFLDIDHPIYVDAVSGNDDTNDGSELKPFKTMEKAFTKVNDYDVASSIGIILGDGQYNNGEFTRTTNNTNKIMIIGNTKSELITTGIYSNSVGADPCKCIVEYYRLIWSDDGVTSISNKIAFAKDVNIYNVVFNNVKGDSNSYFLPNSGASIHVQNCNQNFRSDGFFRTTHGTISVIDSIGAFTSGYGTTQDKWDTGGNIIKDVQYDSEHVPTDTEYKNLGIGENPDGTRSHVGVYGGEFGWGTWETFLIQQGNKYYTVKDGTFDEVVDLDANFFDRGCSLVDIYDNLNLINGEFKLISNAENSVVINGIKSKIEMVVANDDFLTTIQENIDYFECQSDLSGNGVIKMAVSTDSGVTWKTHESGQFKDLNIEIPDKKYSELIQEDKIKWENARDVILAQGIDSKNLKNIDFNGLNPQKTRFAYVYNITDMNDVVVNNKLIWQFDSKGSMKEMNDDEYEARVYSSAIEFKSLVDNDMIKVNVFTGGKIGYGSGGSSDFENQEW